MNRYTFILPTLATLLAAPVMAHEPVCHDSETFRVAALEHAESAGTRFAVSAMPADPAQPCVFDAASAHFVIGSPDDPLWFSSLHGRYLVLSRSTGPQGDLVVYDLSTKGKLLDVPADEFAADDAGVTYWERIEPGTESNCPRFAEYQANGLGAVIAVESRFDYVEGKTAQSGNRRCDATQ